METNMDFLIESLEHELSDAFEVKNRDSLHRCVLMLANNMVTKAECTKFFTPCLPKCTPASMRWTSVLMLSSNASRMSTYALKNKTRGSKHFKLKWTAALKNKTSVSTMSTSVLRT